MENMFRKSQPLPAEQPPPGRPMLSAPIAPPSARLRSVAEKYADEHAQSRVQYLELVDELTHVKEEADQWRNRALLAEGETNRVEKRLTDEVSRHREREAELQAAIDRLKSDSQRDRDTLQQAMAVIRTQYANASNLILDGFKAMDQLNELYVKIDVRLPPQLPGLDDADIKNIAERFGANAEAPAER